MAKHHIALLPGDGIGTEICEQAVRVLNGVGSKFGFELEFEHALVGGCAYEATGHPLPQATLDVCHRSEAVLFGAVGGPQWDTLPAHLRPEAGALLPLRKALGLFAKIRPAVVFPSLAQQSPIEAVRKSGKLDIIVLRELTGGIYFGQPKGRNEAGDTAFDTCTYTKLEIERIAHTAFAAARNRQFKVTSVDKANVLETSRLWREVVSDVAKNYPDVQLEHMLVDNAAMQLIRNPQQFDVVLTENMFGDILSDEASMLTGSLGLLPSASMGSGTFGLFEPVHGSAPDIAGQDLANPLATVLSAAMMLEYSLQIPEASRVIEQAASSIINQGYRTRDIYHEGDKLVGCRQMGDLLLEAVTHN